MKIHYPTMESHLIADLFQAVNEYLWLLNRRYPQKSSLKLVGNVRYLRLLRQNC